MTSEQDEHRVDLRRKALMPGKIVFNDGESLINCVAKNLSATGARLECDSFVDCPQHFLLKLNNGRIYECEVAWMRVKAAGVRFLRAIEAG